MGRKGFTLAELVVVVGICGLAFSLSLPTFTRFKANIKSESSARELAASLRLDQAKAQAGITTNTFARSGYPKALSVKTIDLGNGSKVILSSVGRVRVE
ncbi:MAG: type II secretion system protein [bacterium]